MLQQAGVVRSIVEPRAFLLGNQLYLLNPVLSYPACSGYVTSPTRPVVLLLVFSFLSLLFLLQESQEDGERKSEKELENKKMANNSESSAVWPIWPVGLSNMRKTPLNYPKIPLPIYTPLDFSTRNRLQKNTTDSNLVSEEQTMQCLGSDPTSKRNIENRVRITKKYVPALTAYNYSSLGLGDSKHLKFTNPDTKNLKEMRCLRVGLVPVKHLSGVDYVRLPLIGRDKTTKQSREQPGKKNHCTTGMLGVRFKTDAHKR